MTRERVRQIEREGERMHAFVHVSAYSSRSPSKGVRFLRVVF